MNSPLTYITVFIYLFGFSSNINAQTFNRPIPNNLHPYEFQISDSADHGYYLCVQFSMIPPRTSTTPFVLDSKGYVAMYVKETGSFYSMFNYFPEHNTFSYLERVGQTPTHKCFDSSFNLINSLINAPGIDGDGHEFQILSNGNYVLSGAIHDTVDLSAFTFGGAQGNTESIIKGFVIQEFDSSGNLVFLWNSNDYIHPTEWYDAYNYDPIDFDYCHGNAIEQDTDGNYLLSFRHLNAIYKINRQNGDVIWRLGGKSNDFTFINDVGFSGQHDIRSLGNNRYSLYDNGNMSAAPKLSRGLVYELDLMSMTAELVWEYTDPLNSYARAMGSHQVTESGQHLINYGMIYRPGPSIMFVDSNLSAISSIIFKDSIVAYRSFIYKFNFPFQPSVISCSPISGGATLTAAPGFESYAWSTGDTNQSIQVYQTGEYQVWVEDGYYMIGSEVITITDIMDPCNSSGINEEELSKEKELIGIYDLCGRRVLKEEKGVIYIYHYNDGSAEKKILFD